MSTKTETLTMPVMHVYQLTADSANDTGYTMEQITELLTQKGPDYEIQVTVTTPVAEVTPEAEQSI
jgi:hypothetical protein